MHSDTMCFSNFKRLMFLALLFFTFLLMPRTVRADDFFVTSGILTKYIGSGGNVTIPSNVQVIGGSVFLNNADITSVTIPEGCFEIQAGAFDGCMNLKTVSLPNSLKTIGQMAFARCEGLEYIILPPNLETIEDRVFWNCLSIGSIIVPANVTKIGDCAFGGCLRLIRLEVESGNKYFTSVDNVLFTANMKSLMQYAAGKENKSYTVPDGVEQIEINAFNRAQNLREIIFPNTLKVLKERSLSGCTGLTSMNLPESLEMIQAYTFQNCTNLCKLYVHNKNQKTVVNAFRADTSLTLYGPKSSLIEKHAKKYNIPFKYLDDDTYDFPDPEQKF